MTSLSPELHKWFAAITSGEMPSQMHRFLPLIDSLHPETGLSALMMAARDKHAVLLAQLLEQGADLLVVSRQRQWTALHFAIDGGMPQIVEQLLTSCPPNLRSTLVEKADVLGRTPLHYCIIADNPTLTPEIRRQLIARLLGERADCERKDDEGATALHYCAIYGRKDEAEQLLAQGANPNARSHTCELTPCHIAALEGHEAMALAMLLHGADAELKSTQGWNLKSRFPELCALAQKQRVLAKKSAADSNPAADTA